MSRFTSGESIPDVRLPPPVNLEKGCAMNNSPSLNPMGDIMTDIDSLNEAIDREYIQSVEASNTWMAYLTSCAARKENPNIQREWIRLVYPPMETMHMSEICEQEQVSF